jgi:hypothetical protein
VTSGRDRSGGGGPSTSRSQAPARLLDDPGLARPDVAPEAQSWAVELLRAADPYEVPAGRKQRVRLRLQPALRARAPRLLRPVIVVGAAVIACGAASAALGPFRGWPARTYQRIVGAPSTPLAAGPPPRARRVTAARPAEPIAPPSVEASAPALAAVEPARAAPSVKRRPPPAVSDEDTASVMEAMRALRLENNPVRARALLAHYLERHPNGTLADEALAMTIQAAVSHHDADAPALAARYLKLHPNGPFRALAAQTLAAARGP